MFSAGTYYLRDCCAQISGLYWYFWLCICLRLSASMSAAVSMGTYSAWESTATLCLLGGARGGGRRGAGVYCVATRTACCCDFCECVHVLCTLNVIQNTLTWFTWP